MDFTGPLVSSDGGTVSSTDVIAVDGVRLDADLAIPADPTGWVVFAHGSGSGRRSPRSVDVAATLNRAGIATLLLDLLTEEEGTDRRKVFDVELLAARLLAATRWLTSQVAAQDLPVGYFGASTGAAAALLAAAELGNEISAVVSRGGRPDLAWRRLADVQAPTLLIVGGADRVVCELSEHAAERLTCPKAFEIVPNATRLLEEPVARGRVSELAADWFTTQFSSRRVTPTEPRTPLSGVSR